MGGNGTWYLACQRPEYFAAIAPLASNPTAKTTLCIFCNPHNPTGRVWSEEELKKVSEICRENNM